MIREPGALPGGLLIRVKLGGGRVRTKQLEPLRSLGSWQVGWDLLVKLVNFLQPVQGSVR